MPTASVSFIIWLEADLGHYEGESGENKDSQTHQDRCRDPRLESQERDVDQEQNETHRSYDGQTAGMMADDHGNDGQSDVGQHESQKVQRQVAERVELGQISKRFFTHAYWSGARRHQELGYQREVVDQLEHKGQLQPRCRRKDQDRVQPVEAHRADGNDPLDGISIYDGGDFWHFVTFGFSDLYEKHPEDGPE